jgi:RNA polymerase sigma-70 factor (ECF subfamily)
MFQKSMVMASMVGMTPPLTTLADSSLIKLALGGEPECFAALMDRHLAVIKKRIRSMVQNQADSDDLAQEVVLKVWRRLSTFRWESSFRTWMTRVAINEVLQAYRQHQRLPVYPVPGDFAAVPSTADSPHQALVRVEEIQAVRNAVVELPRKYRQVLILHEFEELSLLETAQRLQSTVPAVKTRLFRARRMLLVALKRSNNPWLASAA